MLNIIRLCVGCESIDDVKQWQSDESRRLPAPWSEHIYTLTTMYPKREAELLDGGSLYWIIKGRIAFRQRFVHIDRVSSEDGGQRTRFILHREWIETVPTFARPFQGWRYFEPDRAPPDLNRVEGGGEALPAELAAELKALGLI